VILRLNKAVFLLKSPEYYRYLFVKVKMAIISLIRVCTLDAVKLQS